jgi:UDP-glucose 4-epimerase
MEDPPMNILVTGGAGYIGSHTCLALHHAGFHPIIVDNFSNSSPIAVERARELAGGADIARIKADVRDRQALDMVFEAYHIDAIIHFAGMMAVGESVSQPLSYYTNNLESTLALLDVKKRHECFNLVFSSSATVYGQPKKLPIPEDHPLSATNPYGRTKLFIEEILRDLAASDSRWHIPALRYFNPVGAHPSGQIGESPLGPPNKSVSVRYPVPSRQPS